jgi:hypothetical protein
MSPRQARRKVPSLWRWRVGASRWASLGVGAHRAARALSCGATSAHDRGRTRALAGRAVPGRPTAPCATRAPPAIAQAVQLRSAFLSTWAVPPPRGSTGAEPPRRGASRARNECTLPLTPRSRQAVGCRRATRERGTAWRGREEASRAFLLSDTLAPRKYSRGPPTRKTRVDRLDGRRAAGRRRAGRGCGTTNRHPQVDQTAWMPIDEEYTTGGHDHADLSTRRRRDRY